MMKKILSPRGMMCASMVTFGTLGLFVRHIGLSSGALALCRAVLAAAVIGLILLVSRKKLPDGALKKELPLLLLSGAALGINWMLLFEAYRYTTVASATLSYYFAPVIVTVLCPLLFREKMTKSQLICFLFATFGIILVTLSGGTSGETGLLGIAFGLGAACFYAGVILLNKFIREITGLHRTFFQFLAAIVVLAPYVAFQGGTGLGTLDAGGWSNLLIVGIVHTGITYFLYFSSLRELPGQQIAILSYIDPLVAVSVSVTLLGEALMPMQLLGGALVLGFTLWNELNTAS